jgi:hypothetical protein
MNARNILIVATAISLAAGTALGAAAVAAAGAVGTTSASPAYGSMERTKKQ